LAAIALREIGLEILGRNFAARDAEIDIVARRGQTLCFVEVKTRRREILSRPAAAVGREKRKHIGRAARAYLHKLGHPALPISYDIVEVVLESRRAKTIRYWPNAFNP
jgi:putative endonuclease